MKVFCERTIVKFICAISISCVMMTNSHSVKADKSVDVSVIKAATQETQAAVVAGGFLLQISAKPNASSSGAVICHITLKNTTDHPLYFPLSGPLTDYEFVVMDEAGRVVRITQFSYDRYPGFIMMGHIAPSQSLSFNLPANRFCDMSKSGVYIVRVSRRVLQKEGDRFKEATITSNSIRINRKTTVINNVKTQSEVGENKPKNPAVGESEIKWGPVIKGIQLGLSSDDTLTELGKTIKITALSSLLAKSIPPHSVLSGDISFDIIFDLTRHGTYLINATTGNFSQKDQLQESPQLTIQVKDNDFDESAEQ